MNILEIHKQAMETAIKAQKVHFETKGESKYCGMAFVKFLDKKDSRVKELVKADIAKKDNYYGIVTTGFAYNHTQCLDLQDTGALAYVKVMNEFGISCALISYIL